MPEPLGPLRTVMPRVSSSRLRPRTAQTSLWRPWLYTLLTSIEADHRITWSGSVMAARQMGMMVATV